METFPTNDKIVEYKKYLNKTFLKLNKNAKADINLVSIVYINFNDDPDTIYTHSAQQYPIQFIMFYWRNRFIVDRIFCCINICLWKTCL